MNAEQIQQLVDEENTNREHNVGQRAKLLIQEIIRLQSNMRNIQDQIIKCQDELKELEVDYLNAKDVLANP